VATQATRARPGVSDAAAGAARGLAPAPRKARGAYFTPPEVCAYIASWAVRTPGDRVLEPSCGQAAFLLAAGSALRARGDGHHRGTLRGVEVHAPSAAAADAAVRAAGEQAEITVADFFTVPARPEFDAVVGNPPYVRYQSFSGPARERARAAAAAAGVRLTNLASSWAAFTVHATRFLAPGGRLGLVLPAELLAVNYAAPIRRHLLERFGQIQLVLFTERIFPGVQEEVVLLLAEGTGPAAAPLVTEVRDLAGLAQLAGLAESVELAGRAEPGGTGPSGTSPSGTGPSGTSPSWIGPSWIGPSGTSPAAPETGERPPGGAPGRTPVATAEPRAALAADPAATWMPALLPPRARAACARLVTAGAFGPLERWGRTTLGAVTGNNRYFTLSTQAADQLRLADDELVAVSPPGSRHLRALTLTARAHAELGAAGAAIWLFRPGPDPSPGARAYLAEGARTGVPNAYKCRIRDPWWRVPLAATPADLLLTYMNADTVQLATNAAGVAHLNSVHGVALAPEVRALGRAVLPLAALNSVTMLSAETVGRAYGGGLLKLEPGEAARLLVPSPATVERARPALAALRRRVLAALARGDVTGAARHVDAALFGPALDRPALDGPALDDGTSLGPDGPDGDLGAVVAARTALRRRRAGRAGRGATARPDKPEQPEQPEQPDRMGPP